MKFLKLFRISGLIATADQAPPFWPASSGLFFLFLFAADSDDATLRAERIIQAMPFVFADPEVKVQDCDQHSAPLKIVSSDVDSEMREQMMREMEEQARVTGIAFCFAARNEPVPRKTTGFLIQFRPPCPDVNAEQF